MEIEDNVTPEIERITAELQKLKGMTIHVGIQNGNAKGAAGEDKDTPADILTIAGVHEFGATIKAKNVSNLAIPIADKAIGKSPRDFEGLFFIRSKAGYLFGCISPKRKGTPKQSGRPKDTKPRLHKPGPGKPPDKKEEDIEYLFILFPSVDIPERSFIRAGYEANKDVLEDACRKAISGIVFNGWDALTAANHIGMTAVGCIQMYLNTPSNFDMKGSITKSTSKWPNSPLVESGRLRNSITYVIEGG